MNVQRTFNERVARSHSKTRFSGRTIVPIHAQIELQRNKRLFAGYINNRHIVKDLFFISELNGENLNQQNDFPHARNAVDHLWHQNNYSLTIATVLHSRVVIASKLKYDMIHPSWNSSNPFSKIVRLRFRFACFVQWVVIKVHATTGMNTSEYIFASASPSLFYANTVILPCFTVQETIFLHPVF